jgi:tRNA uridine 5-carboxymethylaminomethyl modification enzyme
MGCMSTRTACAARHSNCLLGAIDRASAEAMETDARYAVYLERQEREFQDVRKEEKTEIPESVDFSRVAGLSNELRQKLDRRQPRTLADAQRIDGMTPAALALILATVRQRQTDERRGAA